MTGITLVINDPQNCSNLKDWRSMQYGDYPFQSILCCPYFVDGHFGGLITCESMKQHYFGMEEKLLVRAFADGLSLSYRSKLRYDQQLLLEQKQRYIEELNTNLERKVEERTEQVFLKNIKLEKFAFINAHEIRGPICRLLGLRNLIDEVDNHEEFVTVKEYISKSIDELDEITKQSNRLLEEASKI